jgi:hypothetical protein
MTSTYTKPLLAFCGAFTIIAVVLFLFPINLFPGEIIMSNSETDEVVSAPISLSYFIGIGYETSDLIGVKSFHLKLTGYALAFCFLIGIPFLIAFRVFLKNQNK